MINNFIYMYGSITSHYFNRVLEMNLHEISVRIDPDYHIQEFCYFRAPGFEHINCQVFWHSSDEYNTIQNDFITTLSSVYTMQLVGTTSWYN